MIMTFKSNLGVAENAVSGFKGFPFSPAEVEVSFSDVSSMRTGKSLANQIFQDASHLNDKVLQIAQAIPEYAAKVEMDDLRDAKLMKPPLFSYSEIGDGLAPKF